jgi:hypothetical protein
LIATAFLFPVISVRTRSAPVSRETNLKLVGEEIIVLDGIAPLVSHLSQYFSNLPTGRHALFQLRLIRLRNVVWNSTDSRHLWIIINPDAAWHDRCHCYLRKQRKVNDLMKIDMSFWTAFLFIGTDLLGRAIVQGVEPGLISTSIEGRCCYCETVIGVGESE